MHFEHAIALRYLRGVQGRAEGKRFLRLVTAISVTGVGVGVCALIVALAVVRGFSQEIKSKIIGFGAHVQVENFRDAPVDGAAAVERQLEAEEEISLVSPVIHEFALIRAAGGESDGVMLHGVRELPAYLTEHLMDGTNLGSALPQRHQPVVIGSALSRNLSLVPGDRVTLVSLRTGTGNMSPGTPRLKQFIIAGIYETSLADFDAVNIFAPLEEARELFMYGADQVTRFDLTLSDGANSEAAADRLGNILDFPLMTRSIQEVYSSLFAWVNLQENIIPLVISIIVIVAAFNIVGTLLMIILEKTREIGVFASLGAGQSMLRRIFLILGVYIGFAGVVSGSFVALVFSWLQLRYSIIPLPEEAYYMSAAPIELSGLDFLVVALVTILLCAVSSVYCTRIFRRPQ